LTVSVASVAPLSGSRSMARNTALSGVISTTSGTSPNRHRGADDFRRLGQHTSVRPRQQCTLNLNKTAGLNAWARRITVGEASAPPAPRIWSSRQQPDCQHRRRHAQPTAGWRSIISWLHRHPRRPGLVDLSTSGYLTVGAGNGSSASAARSPAPARLRKPAAARSLYERDQLCRDAHSQCGPCR